MGSKLLVIALGALFAACTPDASCGEAPPGAVTACQLCASPESYDGRRVTVVGPFTMRPIGTAAGCCCCNVVQGEVQLPCERRPVVLVWAPGATPTEVRGAPVQPYEGGPWSYYGSASRTTFGCTGQQCFEQCTPGRPEEIASVVGVFRNTRIDVPHLDTPSTYEAHIEVESVTFLDRGTPPPPLTSADCARVTDASDGAPCSGEFACELPDGRLVHCVNGVMRAANCVPPLETDAGPPGLDGSVPDGGGLDAGVPDGGGVDAGAAP